MADYNLTRYTPSEKAEWDVFVNKSRNGTFLFLRDYMDYHADRFVDCSLIVRKGGRIAGLLPANIRHDEERAVLQSHGGLTYGGWILPARHADVADVAEFFRLLREFAGENGISSLDYKTVPYIYQSMPSQEDLYLLYREGAILTERNISCSIDLKNNPGLNKLQRRNLQRANKSECRIIETKDITEFHSLLTQCLADRHGVTPVHSASELQLLRDRFPENIRIFLVVTGDVPQAGVCVYDTGFVAHAQYICSTPEARREGYLTLLFSHLFDLFSDCRYFDFGISTEDHGLFLNKGLYRQKSSLGGSGVVYERYHIELSDRGL